MQTQVRLPKRSFLILISVTIQYVFRGVAQLVARQFWELDAAGSSPVTSTMLTVEIGFKSYFNRLSLFVFLL